MSAASASAGARKIGIIGAGKIGGALGKLWAKAGNAVMFASRHPEALVALAAEAGARAGTPAEAAAFGDIVVIAVPYSMFAEVAAVHHAALAGKVVLDASNAIDPRDGAALGEAVRKQGIGFYAQALLPGAHLVRGFNAINYKDMEAIARRAGEPVAIPLASDDAVAIAVGSDLVCQAGFVPVVVPLARAGAFGPRSLLGTGVFTEVEWKRKLGLAT